MRRHEGQRQGRLPEGRQGGARGRQGPAKVQAAANEKGAHSQAAAEARKDAKEDTADAQYAAARERCDAMQGNAKDKCIADAKKKFNKS